MLRKLALLAVVFMSHTVVAQEAKNGPAPRPATISGKVIDQGRILIGEADSHWIVTNFNLLKPFQGEEVTVQYRVATDAHRIRVLSVTKERAENRYTSNLGDAAFRR